MRINSEFEASRDRYGWTLKQKVVGRSKKTGEETINEAVSFHSNFRQVAEHILDLKAGECKDVQQMQQLLERLLDRLHEVASKSDEELLGALRAELENA